jgi:O-antigen/teichoic acid export membrane protein
VSSRAGPPAHRRASRTARLGWTTTDQMVSSATNAALSILVARQVSAEEFGAFALAFVVFMYAVGICVALVSDPLTVRFSGVGRRERQDAIAQSAGAAVVLGVALGLLVAPVGLVLGGELGPLLLVLSLFLPGLLLQNHWRLAFFASGWPRSAFANDAVWAVLQIGGVVALIATGRGSPATYLAVWGASATVAAIVGARQAGVLPRPSAARSWVRDHQDIGLRFTWGFLLNQGAFNTAFVVVGVISGAAAVGAMRAAQVLVGPVRVAFAALNSYALPLMVRLVAENRRLGRPALLMSGVSAAITVLWTALLASLPDSVGRALLGETWTQAGDLLVLYGLQVGAIGVGAGAIAGLRAFAEAGLTLRVILLQAPLALALGALGAWLDGARGAVLGLFVTQALGAVYSWWLFWKASREREPRPRTPAMAVAR